MPHKILIAEFMDTPAVDALRAKFDVDYHPAYVQERAKLLAAVVNVRALIVRNMTQVNREVLDAAPKLRVVGRLGVGLDNIDMVLCRERGVTVFPATGANALSVAEYVIGTAMVLLRGTYMASTEVAQGAWPRARLMQGRELAGKTLGLVGLGEIGRLTAKLAHAFGVRVIAHDPMLELDDPVWSVTGITSTPLDALLGEADVVSLHVPLTDGTRNLLNPARLKQMRKGAILINTARGGIVDEDALAQALIDGNLGGAAIDVYTREPVLAGSPLARIVTAGITNLILTPHVAGVTSEANARVSNMIAERMIKFFEKLPHC